MEQKKQIAILGSTGSIGTQALEVIEEHADLYEVYCLTANNKVELLAEQAHKFKPAAIVIANEARYDALKALMSDMPEVKVYAGAKALDEIVEAGPIDMVLTAMVGFSGLKFCYLPESGWRGSEPYREDSAHSLRRSVPSEIDGRNCPCNQG